MTLRIAVLLVLMVWMLVSGQRPACSDNLTFSHHSVIAVENCSGDVTVRVPLVNVTILIRNVTNFKLGVSADTEALTLQIDNCSGSINDVDDDAGFSGFAGSSVHTNTVIRITDSNLPVGIGITRNTTVKNLTYSYTNSSIFFQTISERQTRLLSCTRNSMLIDTKVTFTNIRMAVSSVGIVAGIVFSTGAAVSNLQVVASNITLASKGPNVGWCIFSNVTVDGAIVHLSELSLHLEPMHAAISAEYNRASNRALLFVNDTSAEHVNFTTTNSALDYVDYAFGIANSSAANSSFTVTSSRIVLYAQSASEFVIAVSLVNAVLVQSTVGLSSVVLNSSKSESPNGSEKAVGVSLVMTSVTEQSDVFLRNLSVHFEAKSPVLMQLVSATVMSSTISAESVDAVLAPFNYVSHSIGDDYQGQAFFLAKSIFGNSSALVIRQFFLQQQKQINASYLTLDRVGFFHDSHWLSGSSIAISNLTLAPFAVYSGIVFTSFVAMNATILLSGGTWDTNSSQMALIGVSLVRCVILVERVQWRMVVSRHRTELLAQIISCSNESALVDTSVRVTSSNMTVFVLLHETRLPVVAAFDGSQLNATLVAFYDCILNVSTVEVFVPYTAVVSLSNSVWMEGGGVTILNSSVTVITRTLASMVSFAMPLVSSFQLLIDGSTIRMDAMNRDSKGVAPTLTVVLFSYLAVNKSSSEVGVFNNFSLNIIRTTYDARITLSDGVPFVTTLTSVFMVNQTIFSNSSIIVSTCIFDLEHNMFVALPGTVRLHSTPILVESSEVTVAGTYTALTIFAVDSIDLDERSTITARNSNFSITGRAADHSKSMAIGFLLGRATSIGFLTILLIHCDLRLLFQVETTSTTNQVDSGGLETSLSATQLSLVTLLPLSNDSLVRVERILITLSNTSTTLSNGDMLAIVYTQRTNTSRIDVTVTNGSHVVMAPLGRTFCLCTLTAVNQSVVTNVATIVSHSSVFRASLNSTVPSPSTLQGITASLAMYLGSTTVFATSRLFDNSTCSMSQVSNHSNLLKDTFVVIAVVLLGEGNATLVHISLTHQSSMRVLCYDCAATVLTSSGNSPTLGRAENVSIFVGNASSISFLVVALSPTPPSSIDDILKDIKSNFKALCGIFIAQSFALPQISVAITSNSLIAIEGRFIMVFGCNSEAVSPFLSLLVDNSVLSVRAESLAIIVFVQNNASVPLLNVSISAESRVSLLAVSATPLISAMVLAMGNASLRSALISIQQKSTLWIHANASYDNETTSPCLTGVVIASGGQLRNLLVDVQHFSEVTITGNNTILAFIAAQGDQANVSHATLRVGHDSTLVVRGATDGTGIDVTKISSEGGNDFLAQLLGLSTLLLCFSSVMDHVHLTIENNSHVIVDGIVTAVQLLSISTSTGTRVGIHEHSSLVLRSTGSRNASLLCSIGLLLGGVLGDFDLVVSRSSSLHMLAAAVYQNSVNSTDTVHNATTQPHNATTQPHNATTQNTSSTNFVVGFAANNVTLNNVFVHFSSNSTWSIFGENAVCIVNIFGMASSTVVAHATLLLQNNSSLIINCTSTTTASAISQLMAGPVAELTAMSGVATLSLMNGGTSVNSTVSFTHGSSLVMHALMTSMMLLLTDVKNKSRFYYSGVAVSLGGGSSGQIFGEVIGSVVVVISSRVSDCRFVIADDSHVHFRSASNASLALLMLTAGTASNITVAVVNRSHLLLAGNQSSSATDGSLCSLVLLFERSNSSDIQLLIMRSSSMTLLPIPETRVTAGAALDLAGGGGVDINAIRYTLGSLFLLSTGAALSNVTVSVMTNASLYIRGGVSTTVVCAACLLNDLNFSVSDASTFRLVATDYAVVWMVVEAVVSQYLRLSMTMDSQFVAVGERFCQMVSVALLLGNSTSATTVARNIHVSVASGSHLQMTGNGGSVNVVLAVSCEVSSLTITADGDSTIRLTVNQSAAANSASALCGILILTQASNASAVILRVTYGSRLMLLPVPEASNTSNLTLDFSSPAATNVEALFSELGALFLVQSGSLSDVATSIDSGSVLYIRGGLSSGVVCYQCILSGFSMNVVGDSTVDIATTAAVAVWMLLTPRLVHNTSLVITDSVMLMRLNISSGLFSNLVAAVVAMGDAASGTVEVLSLTILRSSVAAHCSRCAASLVIAFDVPMLSHVTLHVEASNVELVPVSDSVDQIVTFSYDMAPKDILSKILGPTVSKKSVATLFFIRGTPMKQFVVCFQSSATSLRGTIAILLLLDGNQLDGCSISSLNSSFRMQSGDSSQDSVGGALVGFVAHIGTTIAAHSSFIVDLKNSSLNLHMSRGLVATIFFTQGVVIANNATMAFMLEQTGVVCGVQVIPLIQLSLFFSIPAPAIVQLLSINEIRCSGATGLLHLAMDGVSVELFTPKNDFLENLSPLFGSRHVSVSKSSLVELRIVVCCDSKLLNGNSESNINDAGRYSGFFYAELSSLAHVHLEASTSTLPTSVAFLSLIHFTATTLSRSNALRHCIWLRNISHQVPDEDFRQPVFSCQSSVVESADVRIELLNVPRHASAARIIDVDAASAQVVDTVFSVVRSQWWSTSSNTISIRNLNSTSYNVTLFLSRNNVTYNASEIQPFTSTTGVVQITSDNAFLGNVTIVLDSNLFFKWSTIISPSSLSQIRVVENYCNYFRNRRVWSRYTLPVSSRVLIPIMREHGFSLWDGSICELSPSESASTSQTSPLSRTASLSVSASKTHPTSSSSHSMFASYTDSRALTPSRCTATESQQLTVTLTIRPPTTSVSLYVARRGCPEITITSNPERLSDAVFKSQRVVMNVTLPSGHRWWNRPWEYDGVPFFDFMVVGSNALPQPSGFQLFQQEASLKNTTKWKFAGSQQYDVITVEFPIAPHYIILMEETIELSFIPRAVQFQCVGDTRPRATFRVVPETASSLVSATRTATDLGAFSSLGSVGVSNTDSQLLILLAGTQCSSVVQGTSTGSFTAYLLSPFYYMGVEWMVYGNILVVMGVSILQISAAGIFYVVKLRKLVGKPLVLSPLTHLPSEKEVVEEQSTSSTSATARTKMRFGTTLDYVFVACARVQFPALTFAVAVLLHQGTFLAVAKIITLGHGSQYAPIAATVGLVYSICWILLFRRLFRMPRKYLESGDLQAMALDYRSPQPQFKDYDFSTLHAFWRFINPVGRWGPREQTNMFGKYFGSTRSGFMHRGMYPACVITMEIIFAVIPFSNNGCVVQFTLLGLPLLIAGVLVLSYRPHRVPVISVLTGTAHVVAGIISIISAVLGSTLQLADTTYISLQLVQLSLGLVSSLIVAIRSIASARVFYLETFKWKNVDFTVENIISTALDFILGDSGAGRDRRRKKSKAKKAKTVHKSSSDDDEPLEDMLPKKKPPREEVEIHKDMIETNLELMDVERNVHAMTVLNTGPPSGQDRIARLYQLLLLAALSKHYKELLLELREAGGWIPDEVVKEDLE